MANLLDAERQGVTQQAAHSGLLHSHKEREVTDMREEVLFHTAEEIRNRNAGTALELYYHLVETEAKADLAEQSLQILRDVSNKLLEMKKKGLRLPVDYQTLVRQEIDVQIQQTQLQQAIDQLNSELIGLLGLHGCTPEERLWPADDFRIANEAIAVEDAVAQGLAQRPELVLLRELDPKLNLRTLPAARQFAQSVNPLLGMSGKQSPLLLRIILLRALRGGFGDPFELEVRRQQLEQQRAHREEAVAQEIRQAVRTLASQQQLVVLNRDKRRSWETKVQELEDRSRQGLASETDVALAKLDTLRARGEIVKEVMAWHIARAKLQQAQGILPLHCPKPAPSPCGPASTAAGNKCCTPALGTADSLPERRESPLSTACTAPPVPVR
jgi:outer membrane protein TolC